MPEGPEVETVCRNLREFILKKVFEQVIVYNDKLRYPVPQNISQILKGKKILQIERIAKYINVVIEGQYNLIIHLGMSGKILFHKQFTNISLHDHVIFKFNDNTYLYYNDPRKFGMVDLIDKSILKQNKLFIKLGVNPLDKALDKKKLYEKISRKSVPIKAILMNNEIITDIGNIYASESLFEAKINPLYKSNRLSFQQFEVLIKAIRSVLLKAITAHGSSFNNYVDLEGNLGNFQNYFKVYKKAGSPCINCSTIIEKYKLSGRATYYCPRCQIL